MGSIINFIELARMKYARFIVCLISFFLPVLCMYKTVIYVDPAVESSYTNGRIDTPFSTLESALKYVQQLRESGNNDEIEMVFRAGKYYFKKGYLLDASMSN